MPADRRIRQRPFEIGRVGNQRIKGRVAVAESMVGYLASTARATLTLSASSATRPWLNSSSSSIRRRERSAPGKA
jgi:hypothetical protein